MTNHHDEDYIKSSASKKLKKKQARKQQNKKLKDLVESIPSLYDLDQLSDLDPEDIADWDF